MPTPRPPHDLDLAGVMALQTRFINTWHEAPFQPTESGILATVELNHHVNFSLWHEVDIASLDGQGDERIHMAKRLLTATTSSATTLCKPWTTTCWATSNR